MTDIPYEVKKNLLGQAIVYYVCPKCGERLKSPISDAGNSDTCPACHAKFVVPGSDERAAIEREQEAVKQRKREAAEQKKEERRKRQHERQAEEKAREAQKARPEERAVVYRHVPSVSQAEQKANKEEQQRQWQQQSEQERKPTRNCPYCGESILSSARKCRCCGEFLDGSREVLTNVKQGALLGATACFGIGIGLMIMELWLFVVYVPLFFASFVLSIVAMAQQRIVGGLGMLLLTLFVPPIVVVVVVVGGLATPVAEVEKSTQDAHTDIRETDAGDTLNPNLSPETLDGSRKIADADSSPSDLVSFGEPFSTSKFTVSLIEARIDRPKVKDLMGDVKRGEDPVLIVVLHVKNNHDRKILRYDDGNMFLGGNFQLRDDVGNVIRGVSYGTGTEPVGALTGMEDILPGEEATHLEVFSVPPPKTKYLVLTMDLDAFGGEDKIRFKIPVGKIKNYSP